MTDETTGTTSSALFGLASPGKVMAWAVVVVALGSVLLAAVVTGKVF